ncbi:MAG: type II CAAX endopeptidase family protein [Candidatus Bathyarchaeota archaeon]|jgi:membrane protease YdiL (CAAX protease family)
MGSEHGWNARSALACYFSLAGGIILGAFVLIFLLVVFGFSPNGEDLGFPIVILATPINELIILGITVLFARNKGADFKELGWKRASLGILVIASILTIPLFFSAVGISVLEETLFGPDPGLEGYEAQVMPRNSLQLIILVIFSFVLVGPCEEIAFRGFIQKGFENSFGNMRGLLVASLLFGLLHGLNTLYAIATTFVAGLILGYVWQRTGGNTIVSALMHGLNNSIAFILAYFSTV